MDVALHVSSVSLVHLLQAILTQVIGHLLVKRLLNLLEVIRVFRWILDDLAHKLPSLFAFVDCLELVIRVFNTINVHAVVVRVDSGVVWSVSRSQSTRN